MEATGGVLEGSGGGILTAPRVLHHVDPELEHVAREELVGRALLAPLAQSLIVHKRPVAALRVLQEELQRQQGGVNYYRVQRSHYTVHCSSSRGVITFWKRVNATLTFYTSNISTVYLKK